jgi:hypothetical protein
VSNQHEERIEQLKTNIADAAKELLIELLLRDAGLDEAGNVALVGDEFEEWDSIFYFAAGTARQVQMAREFYYGWQDERNHGFVNGYYKGIAQSDWPRLARYIASCLAADEAITDPVLLDNFVYKPRPSLATRIRSYLRRS